MTASPSPPRMLSQSCLLNAEAAYLAIAELQHLSLMGRQTEVARGLALLARHAECELPVVKGVIRTQQQAAEHLHLTQRPDIRIIACASIGIAAEHSDPSNDEQSTTTNPAEPAPSSPVPGGA